FRAARQDNVGLTEFDHAPGFANRVVRGGAGGNDAHVRTAHPEFHRDQSARHVADEHWNGESGNALWTFGKQNGVLVFERFESPAAAADENAETVRIFA